MRLGTPHENVDGIAAERLDATVSSADNTQATTDAPAQASAAWTAPRYVLWPVLFSVCMTLTAIGVMRGEGAIWFNVTYIGLAVSLAVLERLLPY